jgi:DNA-binding GntR family transcriptional regulator
MDELIVPSNVTDIKPIRDIIYEYLRRAIMDGVIKPGERIVERSYAEKFNASRTPIREAIRKLEMEGFVVYIPRHGVVAKGLNQEEIAEIYAIRCGLESLAVRAAVDNITKEQLHMLEEVVRQAVAANKDENCEQVVEKLRKFDEIILDASKMPRLKKMISGLQESLRYYRKRNLTSISRRQTAIKEHKQILEAIVNKDASLAEKLLCNHINGAKEVLLKNISKLE